MYSCGPSSAHCLSVTVVMLGVLGERQKPLDGSFQCHRVIGTSDQCFMNDWGLVVELVSRKP